MAAEHVIALLIQKRDKLNKAMGAPGGGSLNTQGTHGKTASARGQALARRNP
jgi:hypothetical protein